MSIKTGRKINKMDGRQAEGYHCNHWFLIYKYLTEQSIEYSYATVISHKISYKIKDHIFKLS
jgi:hypothetical protein